MTKRDTRDRQRSRARVAASRGDASVAKKATLQSREATFRQREAEVAGREGAASRRAMDLDVREARARPREELDRLISQTRGANEQLVLTTLRAEHLAEEATAARESAETARAKLELIETALREASQRKDEFLAMLGHELRNPLAPIVTALEIMKLRGDTSSLREREVIERQVRHMVVLIDDLLDVARITSGKIELHRAHVEIASVLAEAVETASPLFESRHHVFRASVPRTGLVVNGDPVRLGQVFANLLTNAAKYTDPGGMITLTAGREDGSVRVSVRDNGSGIAPELLKAMFDPFVQDQQTIARARGGLGLGLAIVRGIVELHGGEVSAKSEGRGKGSELVVRLPAVEEARVEAPDLGRGMAASEGTAQLGARRVLVVDDNADAAEMLAEVLGVSGREVSIAHDGPEALRMVTSFEPDAVVLDIGLPIMDGYEVARRLRERERALPARRRTLLIAVTGYGQETDRQRSESAGFDLHLVKPVGLDTLRAALAKGAQSPSTEAPRA